MVPKLLITHFGPGIEALPIRRLEIFLGLESDLVNALREVT